MTRFNVNYLYLRASVPKLYYVILITYEELIINCIILTLLGENVKSLVVLTFLLNLGIPLKGQKLDCSFYGSISKCPEAISLFKDLCLKGAAHACGEHSLYLLSINKIVESDKFAEIGCNLDDGLSCANIGLSPNISNLNLKRKSLIKSCHLGIGPACNIVGWNGRGSINESLKNVTVTEIEYFKKGCELKDPGSCYNLACSYSVKMKINKSLVALKESIDFGYRDISKIKSDPDLNNIRNSNVFQKEIIDYLDDKSKRIISSVNE